MESLETLVLEGCHISDEAFALLANMKLPNLKKLDISDSL